MISSLCARITRYWFRTSSTYRLWNHRLRMPLKCVKWPWSSWTKLLHNHWQNKRNRGVHNLSNTLSKWNAYKLFSFSFWTPSSLTLWLIIKQPARDLSDIDLWYLWDLKVSNRHYQIKIWKTMNVYSLLIYLHPCSLTGLSPDLSLFEDTRLSLIRDL